ncbi:MAG: hypothetical protein AMJ59_27030 [Gammaproteobacteria bacterium SG8_31]|nr:MAG: hypothetical protein AMJ59_27030 [Gammaproteobacteria bacterium SG8_31]
MTALATAQDKPQYGDGGSFVPPPASVHYSPYPEQNFPNQVFFGDTHLHTAYSPDAGLIGATLTPDDAFRFARGETVISSTGVPARLARPLDFLVVSDHAENLGLPAAVTNRDPQLLATEFGRKIAEIMAPGTIESKFAGYEYWELASQTGKDPLAGTDFGKSMWAKATEAAERNNVPGKFTAFIGFEWTSTPNGNNLHRNVIFRGGKESADKLVPISAYDTEDPERLWDWMEQAEKKAGVRLLAIPHNGNLSNGLMFDDVTYADRRPIDRAYAERRMRWESVYEVTQIKGDGETHPKLSPKDKFADFYRWDKGSFGPEPKTPDMLPREYAREAYKRGLAYQAKLGANPFKFGMIGSTDSHTGLSTAEENNFFGKIVALEPTADPIRFYEPLVGRFSEKASEKTYAWQTAAAGLAAVWARENTREAIWDALTRKEVFATTGTRMRVRVFGGWRFRKGDLDRSDFAKYGYDNGVPMGGDLTNAPAGAKPGFLIRAVRDPEGANLDRVQVVKGWLEADGTKREKVYDVIWSGNRKPGKDGTVPPVGSTVKVSDASYTNAIGDPFLQVFWTDKDFNPAERAFYYIRVLEIPTPRWTTYDAKMFGVKIPEGAPVDVQERAYTSPIWYSP